MHPQMLYMLTMDRQQSLRREADEARLAKVAGRAANGAPMARKSPSALPALAPWAPVEAVFELFSPGGRAFAAGRSGEEAARA